MCSDSIIRLYPCRLASGRRLEGGFAGKNGLLESGVELINILDRRSRMVTMFALLSVRNDGHAVRTVCT